MKHAANILTFTRIILSIFLLFLKTFSPVFIGVYIICGLTDMLDGYIARKTKSVSDFGSRLDSIADTVFVFVCLIKILPVLNIEIGLWIWIVAIAVIKITNIVSGYYLLQKFVSPHSVANKATGLLLFVLPLTSFFVDINITAIPVCIIATFAALQESYLIRAEKKRASS